MKSHSFASTGAIQGGTRCPSEGGSFSAARLAYVLRAPDDHHLHKSVEQRGVGEVPEVVLALVGLWGAKPSSSSVPTHMKSMF